MSDVSLAGASRGGLRLPWLTLLLGLVTAALFVLAGPAPELWLYDRAAIARGEVWRLVTGHLAHSDAVHLAWNLGAFLILGAIAEGALRLRPVGYLGLLLAAALAIDAWLWWIEPQIVRYCGLSGLLNGLLAALALALWRRSGSPLCLLLLAGDLAKIGLEAWLGGALLPTSGAAWVSVPGAHLAGLAAGAAVVFIPGFHKD